MYLRLLSANDQEQWGELTKITLSPIRDLSATVHFSFLDSHYNLADSGTKLQGNAQILLKLAQHRVFEISFVGRRESRRLKNWSQLKD